MIDNDPSGEMRTTVCEIDEGARPSEAVVHAVATLTDATILDLAPLYDAIDPEHLDAVIGGRSDGALEESSVSFRYNGCRVTVDQDAVRVRTDAD